MAQQHTWGQQLTSHASKYHQDGAKAFRWLTKTIKWWTDLVFPSFYYTSFWALASPACYEFFLVTDTFFGLKEWGGKGRIWRGRIWEKAFEGIQLLDFVDDQSSPKVERFGRKKSFLFLSLIIPLKQRRKTSYYFLPFLSPSPSLLFLPF